MLFLYIFLSNFISAFTLYDFSKMLSTILLLKRSCFEFNECNSQFPLYCYIVKQSKLTASLATSLYYDFTLLYTR